MDFDGQANLTVHSSEGIAVNLLSLWDDQKIALFFVRHLACRFCLHQIKDLVDNKVYDALKDKGVDLVVVSLGQVEQCKRWLEVTGFQGRLYVDTNGPSGNPAIAKLPETVGSRPYYSFRLTRKAVMSDERVKDAPGIKGNVFTSQRQLSHVGDVSFR